MKIIKCLQTPLCPHLLPSQTLLMKYVKHSSPCLGILRNQCMLLASKNFFAVTFATNKSRSGNSISDIGVQIQHFRPHFDRKKMAFFLWMLPPLFLYSPIRDTTQKQTYITHNQHLLEVLQKNQHSIHYTCFILKS